jgi:hypothetical protein
MRIYNTYTYSWPRSYDSWIFNYQCNRCLSPLVLWVRLPLRAKSTTLCDKVCQWLAAGRWFSPGTTVSSTNKTDHHDITEILLKVALNTIKPNQNQRMFSLHHLNKVWFCYQLASEVLWLFIYFIFSETIGDN